MAITNRATILDYTSSHYIPVADGNVAIFDGYRALTHVTDLSNFTTIAEETQNLTDLLPHSHMRKLLESDVNQINRAINSLRIHHRHARSINILGTALKYIAGTPDYDDYMEIRNKENELVKENNAQKVLNTEIQSRINDLTRTVNTLIKNTKVREIDSGYLYGLLNERNRAILRELDNIALSITLGKLQIINPILLDSSEVNFILNSETYFNISINEIVVNSRLKILQDENIITFVIRFPKIVQFCTKKLIVPVVHNNKMLSFKIENVAKCDYNYIMLRNCEKKSIISFCQKVNNEDNSCLNNLLNKNSAACNTISAHNVPPLLEIDDGIVIINDQSSKIIHENETKTLQKGTYLITFDNVLTVNSTEFRNMRKIAFKSPEIPIAHTVNLTNHISTLSLQYLHELNFKNVNYISLLHSKIRGTWYISASLFILILVICVAYLVTKIQRSKQITNVLRNYGQTRTSDA